MENERIRHFQDVINAMGVQVIYLQEPIQEFVIDFGLRRQLYENYDYLNGLDRMFSLEEEHTIYMIKDQFESYYISGIIPKALTGGEGTVFFHIGPYLLESPDSFVEKVIQKEGIPLFQELELKEYYKKVPYIRSRESFENIVMVMAAYLFGIHGPVNVNRIENLYGKNLYPGKIVEEEEHGFSQQLIEERYRDEDLFMDAIQEGNLENALLYSRKLEKYLFFQHSGTILELKSQLVTWNTLCRKAAQRAEVHPAHIEELSASYMEQIEQLYSRRELTELSMEMLRKYCFLVRNHSLKGHSRVIQETLNYIDFHLKERLSLGMLAEKVSVSPNYLSAQFKKEMRQTVIEYINQKRIYQSLVLLATSDIPIQEVAERVGIGDENYFSRLFKKVHGDTPKQYRNLMKSKI